MIKGIDEATSLMISLKKDKQKVGPQEVKEKMGDKLNMAKIIIGLTNACIGAKDMLGKLHGQNFELRGKVADLSTTCVNQLKAEINKNQTEIMTKISETVKDNIVSPRRDIEQKSTFADIVGKNKNALVIPMKQAIKQIEKEDERKGNIVIKGLDLNPDITDVKQQEDQLKEKAMESVYETSNFVNHEDGLFKEIRLMGKIVENEGRAPPVLITMGSAELARKVLDGASQLSKMANLRRVYICPDLNKEDREVRKKLVADLKKKIEEFPGQYWVIRSGAVTSKGKYSGPRKRLDSEDEGKEMDRSYRY